MRILPPALFFATAAVMAVAHFALPGAVLPPAPRLVGLPILLAGAWINWAGAARFHATGTNIKTFDDPNRLVTDGLWAWSRNPIYLGFVAMLLGAGLMLGEVLPILLAGAFAVVLDRTHIPFEEAALRRIFGAEYDAYRARVRRWL